VLSRLFRRLFLEELAKAFDAGKLEFFSALEGCRERGAFLRYLGPTREVEWVVYAKRPFAGPEQVLDYVGHYPLISEAGARCRRAVSEPAQEKRNAVTGKTVSTRTGKCQTAESVAEFFEPSSQHLRCFGP
jgi:hypothetical protein